MWQLFEYGFNVDEIVVTTKDRGPFARYNEKSRSLKDDATGVWDQWSKTGHKGKTNGQTGPVEIDLVSAAPAVSSSPLVPSVAS
jgi:hypothetical protein